MNHISSLFPWVDLLGWYERCGRHDLEWRDYSMDESTRMYRVWLSEICLQQTQVERVRGYFQRILEKYTTIHDLARASYEEFFPYYQGLGYYSRARNILKTAKIVSEEYGGVFPPDRKALMILPGVGEYTASAILAFGRGEAYLAWDTNLEKVFARYYHGSRIEKLTEEEKNAVEEDFREYISGLSTFNFQLSTVRSTNNALMDFASTVDLKNPTNIDWEKYPIQSGRFYDTRGSLEVVEVKQSVSFPTPDATVIVILHKDHKIYYGSHASDIPTGSVISTTGEILPEQDISYLAMIEISHLEEGRGEVGYSPFILPSSLTRDTRAYVQDYFREKYGLELSVRPAHRKWISADGKPYIAMNAQIQTGTYTFSEYSKSEAKRVLDSLG